MMNRRSFFRKMAVGLASAAIAVNVELRSLVPTLTDFAPKWWYLIEETLPTHLDYRDAVGGHDYVIYNWGHTKHVRWVTAEELPAMGLKHEDFRDRWEDLPYILDTN